MKVIADSHKCVAAGLCVVAEGAVFDQDEETGTVVILNAEPSEPLHAGVREAAQVCPAQAITISENGSSA